MVRKLMDDEIAELLNRDTVARLATVGTDGYPHVTPMWFLWASGRFYLTSFTDRPHLARIRANPRVGLVVDIEDDLRPDGERPNKQVRTTGHATVTPDTDGTWTTRIRTKYIDQIHRGRPCTPTWPRPRTDHHRPQNHGRHRERLTWKHRLRPTLLASRPPNSSVPTRRRLAQPFDLWPRAVTPRP